MKDYMDTEPKFAALENHPEAEVRTLVLRYRKLENRMAKILAISDGYQKELREASLRMELMAKTDMLTGLANRRDMVERLEMEHARSLRSGIPMAVIMIDIDHFKKVNDKHGHQAGDRALRSVAECIKAMVRRSDSCARWGGEEFLVLCPDCDGPNAMAIAEKVRSSIEGLKLEHGAGSIELSISAGVSAKPKAAERPWDDLVREADEAMYRAKKLGRNRVALYS